MSGVRRVDVRGNLLGGGALEAGLGGLDGLRSYNIEGNVADDEEAVKAKLRLRG